MEMNTFFEKLAGAVGEEEAGNILATLDVAEFLEKTAANGGLDKTLNDLIEETALSAGVDLENVKTASTAEERKADKRFEKLATAFTEDQASLIQDKIEKVALLASLSGRDIGEIVGITGSIYSEANANRMKLAGAGYTKDEIEAQIKTIY